MTQPIPPEAQIRNHPVFLYGNAMAMGFAAAFGVMATLMSLSGRTLVSTEELRRTERALEDARKQIDSQAKELTKLNGELSRMQRDEASTKARSLELQEQLTKLQAEHNRLSVQIASNRDIETSQKTTYSEKNNSPITAPSATSTAQTGTPVESNRFVAGNVRCRNAGSSIICELPIINSTSEDYQFLAFVKQHGGMRDTRYDRFGISKFYDDQGGEYPATLATLGNRNSGIEGQGEFTVLSDTKPILSLRFDGVPTNLKIAKRVRVAIARKLSSGPESLEISAKNVQIEGR